MIKIVKVRWDFAAKSFTENFILDVSLDSGCSYADWSKLSNQSEKI